MGVNSLPKTATRQRRGCDLNPGPTASQSSTLTTRLPSQPLLHINYAIVNEARSKQKPFNKVIFKHGDIRVDFWQPQKKTVYRISYSSNQDGSQEDISLITTLFCFSWICIHYPSQTKTVHKFLALSWYVVFYTWPFPLVYLGKNIVNIIFPFNSWLSFQQLCHLLWG